MVSTNICGCGSVSCPVWVVDVSSTIPKVLITDGGVVIKIKENITNSMHEIVVVSANAGTCSEHTWTFNGSKYVPSKWVLCSKDL